LLLLAMMEGIGVGAGSEGVCETGGGVGAGACGGAGVGFGLGAGAGFGWGAGDGLGCGLTTGVLSPVFPGCDSEGGVTPELG
jgi:hypothetical protein